MAFVYPEQGKVEMRFDATGALFGRSNSVIEVEVLPAGGATGGAFTYTAGYSLYGANAPFIPVSDDSNIQIGFESEATHAKSIGIGRRVNSKGDYSVAVGANANALGYGTAFGSDASVAAVRGTSIGWNGQAFQDATAIGARGLAIGTGSIAIGYYVRAYATNSVSIGSGAYADTGHTNSVAIGQNVATAQANEFVFGVSNSNNISIRDWAANVGVKTGTHSLPVRIGGSLFHFLLSNV